MDLSKYRFDTELLNFVREGEFEKVKDIIEKSLPYLYHKTDTSGSKLIHYSVQYNNQNLTTYLIDKGCDVDAQDSKGTTPLMIAVKKNHEAIVKILLTAGSDIFKLNSEKQSSLHMMNELNNGRHSTIPLLLQELQKKCSTSKEIVEKLISIDFPLYLAALLKDSKVIESMLERGSPVDEAHPIDKYTALHVAVRLDDLKSVNVLLRYGADVNALDFNNGNSLLNVYRVYPEHNFEKIEILKVLVNRGVLMTSCLSNGLFNAIYILTRGNREAIHILIESGLDFNAQDNFADKSVLHYFTSNSNQREVTEELKLHVQKFNVDLADNVGNTALSDAVAKAKIHMVKFLLKQGSKPDTIHNKYGTTPLFYAYGYLTSGCRSRYGQCGEMLLQYNADPQFVVRDRNKTRTIFDSAFESNDLERIKPVIAHLAILEQLGTPIIHIIREKINSHESLKQYFYICQRLLAEQISGRITLFHLLTSDKKKMAQYLNDGSITKIVKHESYKNKMLHYRYYYNVLNRRHFKGNLYKNIKSKAGKLICKCFQNRIHRRHIVVDKIIGYLSDESLLNLSILYYQVYRYNKSIKQFLFSLKKS